MLIDHVSQICSRAALASEISLHLQAASCAELHDNPVLCLGPLRSSLHALDTLCFSISIHGHEVSTLQQAPHMYTHNLGRSMHVHGC